VRRWIWPAIVALLPFAGMCRADDLIPLRYGETASTWKSIFSLPVRVADREGIFARHGLRFDMVQIETGGEASLDALEDGRADFAHVATSFLVTGALAGRKTVAIAAEFDNPVYSLVAKPWIRRIEDLKGRHVGMADMTGTVALATLALFAKHGIQAQDLNIDVILGTSARFQCVTEGDCDAVPLGQPQDFYALRKGLNVLGATTDAVPDFHYTVTAVHRDWAAAHPDIVRRYVEALRDTFAFIRDPANRERMIADIRSFWTASEESATQTMDLFFRPERHVLPKAGGLGRPGIAQVVRFLQDGGVLAGTAPSFEQIVDRRYLDAAGIE
jgi:ABC-type nitrate/sulfonate/bicarbonate transport system substrate-binding protein